MAPIDLAQDTDNLDFTPILLPSLDTEIWT